MATVHRRGRSLTPAALERTARRFIAGQRYHAEALITAVQVNGGGTVSSDPELVGREEDREQTPGAPEGLFGAPPGLSTATVGEAGRMRVLVQQIVGDDERSGRCASPTRSRLWRRHSRACGARL